MGVRGRVPVVERASGKIALGEDPLVSVTGIGVAGVVLILEVTACAITVGLDPAVALTDVG
jgi:hypothetical protein